MKDRANAARAAEARPGDPVWIVDGLRTPMAEYNGRFTEISANELGGLAIAALFALWLGARRR